MKKINFRTLIIIASLAVNGAGFMNVCSAESVDTGEKEVFDINSLGVCGDVNNDGVLSVFDLSRYKMHLLGSDVKMASDYQSDINRDGKKDIHDFIMLKKALLNDAKIWSVKNMPKMDGSTSAIPLEAGFKSEMLGISYADARSIVNHHKTHESFQLLLSGENDLIFTVPISESQQKDAQKAGVKLNLAPVAKESFVFVVNKDNPVDSLTQQQIRDIYSGKITNWKEVGGNDEKIVPYQRNNDSGSQNYMIDFMSGYELMAPPKEYTIGAMGSLMDAIAIYDNSVQSIGYSVYSYAAQMYENSSDVKFIAVDGVKPSRETMADNTYPLLSNTFIMYTDKASKDTLDFVKWATSEEGQKCVLENGYVPISDVKYPDRLKPYTAVGTGKERSADYKPSEKGSLFIRNNTYNGMKYSIDFLKNKDFEKTINSELESVLDDFGKGTNINIYALNGYMSISIIEYAGEYTNECKNVAVLNYDIINNRKIENFSDLFYKDMDFVPLVNNAVALNISSSLSEYIKTDFIGLTGTVDTFSINNLMLNNENPYLSENRLIEYGSYYLPDYMVTGEYFDMNNVCIPDSVYIHDEYLRDEWEVVTEDDGTGEIRQKVVGSAFHTPEEVENHAKVYDKIFERLKEIRDNEWQYGGKTIISQTFKTDSYSYLNVTYGDIGKIDGAHRYMFDSDTGEQLYFSDIFGSEFEHLDREVDNIYNIDMNNNEVSVSHKSGGDVIKFDPSHVNMKYITPGPKRAVPQKLETELKGDTCSGIYGYASSYVLEYGPEEKYWPIEGEWHITAKNVVNSHGDIWYECWDSDDGDYYGWIKWIHIDFYKDADPFENIDNVFTWHTGVGGWAEFLKLNDDGTFYGEFNDYSAGDNDKETGETIWLLDYYGFDGCFENVTKISDNIYKGVIGKVKTNNDRAPYHMGDRLTIIERGDTLSEGDEIIFYLKNTYTADMEKECLNVLGMAKEWRSTPLIIEDNVIYNVTKQTVYFDENGNVEFWENK